MKKVISGLLSVVVLLVSLTIPVFAKEEVRELDTNSRNVPILEGIGKIIEGGTIEIEGTENALYIEFEEQNVAIEDLKNKIPVLLDDICQLYDLGELSDDNWKQYQTAMYSLLELKPRNYSEANGDIKILRAFFDIYENKYQNQSILNCLESMNNARAFDALAQSETLALMLPYTAPYVEERMASIRKSRASINVGAAINYAETYATTINYGEYAYFNGGDCTNFASQILEKAGVGQVVYDSEASGWWHKIYQNQLGMDKHSHSISWVRADTFARYMGYSHVTYSNWSFSSYIETGDFAALDFTRDGSWDHIGFVTNRDSYVGSYGYYDYKIAQHTSNYNDWASHDQCGWESVGLDGGNYAIVRR